MNGHVTITPVAKESGVSIPTVSRVLNGNAPVAAGLEKGCGQSSKSTAFIPKPSPAIEGAGEGAASASHRS